MAKHAVLCSWELRDRKFIRNLVSAGLWPGAAPHPASTSYKEEHFSASQLSITLIDLAGEKITSSSYSLLYKIIAI